MKNKNSIEAQVIEIVHNILKTEELGITLESSSVDTPGWDSLANLEIISSIESWIGRQLSIDEIIEIVCVQDLVEIARKHIF